MGPVPGPVCYPEFTQQANRGVALSWMGLPATSDIALSSAFFALLNPLTAVLREIRACLEAEVLTDVQQRLALLSREMDNPNGQRVLHQPPVASS